jgi:hypothetical protein
LVAGPDVLETRFVEEILRNDNNRRSCSACPRCLPDAWLVAGCLFQTVWNLQAGRDATAGIKDYDLFYFDDADLSEQAERKSASGSACFQIWASPSRPRTRHGFIPGTTTGSVIPTPC